MNRVELSSYSPSKKIAGLSIFFDRDHGKKAVRTSVRILQLRSDDYGCRAGQNDP